MKEISWKYFVGWLFSVILPWENGDSTKKKMTHIMHHLAIFASGTGTNAKKIIEYFNNNEHIKVVLVASNRKHAPVLEMAQQNGVDTIIIDRKRFYDTDEILDALSARKVDWIILAGFLWLMPKYLVQKFQNRILNIHPSLLPKFGGQGMYGMKVHEAVKAAKEPLSGITIHYVNERYDEGEVIRQVTVPIDPTDNADQIRIKVQQLEHLYFAPTIEAILLFPPPHVFDTHAL